MIPIGVTTKHLASILTNDALLSAFEDLFWLNCYSMGDWSKEANESLGNIRAELLKRLSDPQPYFCGDDLK